MNQINKTLEIMKIESQNALAYAGSAPFLMPTKKYIAVLEAALEDAEKIISSQKLFISNNHIEKIKKRITYDPEQGFGVAGNNNEPTTTEQSNIEELEILLQHALNAIPSSQSESNFDETITEESEIKPDMRMAEKAARDFADLVNNKTPTGDLIKNERNQ